MKWFALALFACGPGPVDPEVGDDGRLGPPQILGPAPNPTLEGTQIGEEDCMGNTLTVWLEDADGPVSGDIRWRVDGGDWHDEACGSHCVLWDVDPGVYDVEGFAGALSASAVVVLDEGDRVEANPPCTDFYEDEVTLVLQ